MAVSNVCFEGCILLYGLMSFCCGLMLLWLFWCGFIMFLGDLRVSLCVGVSMWSVCMCTAISI